MDELLQDLEYVEKLIAYDQSIIDMYQQAVKMYDVYRDILRPECRSMLKSVASMHKLAIPDSLGGGCVMHNSPSHAELLERFMTLALSLAAEDLAKFTRENPGSERAEQLNSFFESKLERDLGL